MMMHGHPLSFSTLRSCTPQPSTHHCFFVRPRPKRLLESRSLRIRTTNAVAGSHCEVLHSPWRDGPRGIIWKAADIADAIGGRVVNEGVPGSISTDTRSLEEGDWFLALAGPRFDGHDFLQHALDRGCAGAVANKVPLGWTKGFVQVEGSTLRALQRIGASVRERFKGPVVAITGSCGKTTTRVMTSLALESLGHIHQTDGNLNNHIGVPLTLLRMPSFSAACVLEFGMSHRGEILDLVKIAQPTIRVLLNVGPAHMQNFTSLEEVATAKGEIFADAKERDLFIVNADDALVSSLCLPKGGKVVTFGRSSDCHVRLVAAKNKKGGLSVQVVLEQSASNQVPGKRQSYGLEEPKERQFFRKATSFPTLEAGKISQKLSAENKSLSRVQFDIASPGLHLAINACAAAAIATTVGLPLALVSESLSKYSPLGMRSRLEVTENGILVVNDAYNANPVSMTAALKLLNSMDCMGRRVVFLGDMLELGRMAELAHIEILGLCEELGFDIIGVAGPIFSAIVKNKYTEGSYSERLIACLDSKSLSTEKVVRLLRPNDIVLVKGSRGMRMEILVDAIKERGCD